MKKTLLFVVLLLTACASDDIGPAEGEIVTISGNEMTVHTSTDAITYSYDKAYKYEVGQWVAVWADENGVVNKMELTKTAQQKPPSSLFVAIGDTELKVVRGGYSWSYTDEKGQQVNVETDHAAPPQYIHLAEAIAVDKSQMVKLHAKETIISYEINIWNDNEVLASYSSLETVKETGPHILELIVQYEQGTVSYAAAVDLQ